MMIVKSPEGWNISVYGTELKVSIVKTVYDRGGMLGKDHNYGSSIKCTGPYGDTHTELSIVDHAHPNCEPSLKAILLAHSKQHKLGTFGMIRSPHETDSRVFIDTLFAIGEPHIDDSVEEFVRIPFYSEGIQSWELKTPSDHRFQAFRKYKNRYYETIIIRRIECFAHPLRDGAPNNNITAREESIIFSSNNAEPLQVDLVRDLFK